jgi:uncharacterized protein YdeI (YjbR/CyaY-like superfamily)
MGKRDTRVDAYIAKAPDFAKPILTRIRKVVHTAGPEVEETIKWGAPAFMDNGILCIMASFKEYCALNFWKGSLIVTSDGKRADDSAGQFGKIASVSDLPPDKVLAGYVKEAIKLNESGAKVAKPKPKAKAALETPPALLKALAKNAKARATFEAFSPSNKREYVEWITEAKTDETRQRRVDTAIEWMAEGKSRLWKYQKR